MFQVKKATHLTTFVLAEYDPRAKIPDGVVSSGVT
jgi:hypothetical protein